MQLYQVFPTVFFCQKKKKKFGFTRYQFYLNNIWMTLGSKATRVFCCTIPPWNKTKNLHFSLFLFQRAEGLMVQKWFDPRLIHENRRTGKQPYLNAIHHFDSLWIPGCLVNDGKVATTAESRKMSVKALEVFPNGTVCSVSQ